MGITASNLVANAIGLIESELPASLPELISILIVGRGAELVASNSFDFGTESDLDFLFVLDRQFEKGARLLDIEKLQGVAEDRLGEPVTIRCNGLRMAPGSARIAIDLIPHRYSDVQQRRAHSILENALRTRVLVWGEDVFTSLESSTITKAMVTEQRNHFDSYLHRSLESPMQTHADHVQLIAKSGIIFSSYLILRQTKTLDKSTIVEEVARRFPELAQFNHSLLRAYQAPDSIRDLEALKHERDQLMDLVVQYI